MIKLSELLEYQKEHNLSANSKLTVNVNNRGRVPFINVGPQLGVTLPFMRVHGLVSMGYNVDLVEAAIEAIKAAEVVVDAQVAEAAEAVVAETPVAETTEAVVDAPVAETTEAVAPEAPTEEAAEAVSEEPVEFTPFTKEELFAMTEEDLKSILDGAGIAYSVPKKSVKSFLVNLILTEQEK